MLCGKLIYKQMEINTLKYLVARQSMYEQPEEIQKL